MSAITRLMVSSSEALLGLSRWRKRLIMVAADGIMLNVAVWASLALQFSRRGSLADVIWLVPTVPIITIPIFARLGLYRAVVRHLGEQAFLAVVEAVLLSATLLAVLILVAEMSDVSITVAFTYCIIALLLIGGSRLMMRIYFRAAAGRLRKHVAIYGAGISGVQLVNALELSNEYRPVIFVDDDEALQRRLIHGLPVYAPECLSELIPKLGLSHVLLAMPSISQARRAEIVADLVALPIHVKTVPSFSDLVSGAARFQDIREVDIEELLGRRSASLDETLLNPCVRDRVVMVTGAGGSIGAQLCRRIMKLGAKRLVLFEQSEFQLYQIEMELMTVAERDGLDIELAALLGSVQNRTLLNEVMTYFDVDTVYHTAAYKHVPMVEHNMVEGARNNVLGSWHVATAALATGVQTCVLISTDKAVRPTSVMGASKRLAELIFQGVAAAATESRFSIVRLGNVVGSSGSVIPLFRDQLRRGGPLTVTDPRATRYFMTISEAAELIIQAGSMGSRGEVFVLEMGNPVRIDDLARKMIRLAGLRVRGPEDPDGDIAIEYVGLRPGEKLHEELIIGNRSEPTTHPKIKCAAEDGLPHEQVRCLLPILEELCDKHDCEAIRRALLQAADGYAPSGPVIDRLWLQQRGGLFQARSRHSMGSYHLPAPEVVNLAGTVVAGRAVKAPAAAVSLQSVKHEPHRFGWSAPLDPARDLGPR